MEITRKSPFSGKTKTLDLDITEEQLEKWNNEEPIQTVMGNLSDDEREFLISGILPGEWEEYLPDDI